VLLADVIAASAAVAATRSRTAKAGTIAELLRRAGADEVEPVTAWLAGELRQGALEGVVLDAVATAAGVPAAAVRRAFMLSGRLPETAAIALTGGVDALDAVCLEVGRPVRPMLASPAPRWTPRSPTSVRTSPSSSSSTAPASRSTGTARSSGCGPAPCAR
jgi:DNA ligase-1